MKMLTAAILGTGHIAGGYDEKKYKGDRGIYSHAGAFRKSGRIRLKTVFDVDSRKAMAFAKTWNAEAAGSLADILKGYHDIVSVCTPDKTHYGIVKALLLRKACKTICVEKPAAEKPRQLLELVRLAKKNHIHVVVNFQRHFDGAHIQLAQVLRQRPSHILSVQGLYIKGLDHTGVTMVDTLRFLLGNPRSVLALRRVFNRQIAEYSYDFALYYPTFTVTVRTADSERWFYNYHVFEIDLLLKDRRIALVDNSRARRESGLSHFAYSGVRVLDDIRPVITPTAFSTSMASFMEYLFAITVGRQVPVQNTLGSSYMNMGIIEAVKKSYRNGLKRIPLPETLWKK